MKRRDFVIGSQTAFFGSLALSGIQQPSLGAEFQINNGSINENPSNVDSILVDFSKFRLKASYISDGSAQISVEANLETGSTVMDSVTVDFDSKKDIRYSDVGQILPIRIDGVNTAQDLLEGSVSITVDHPDISETYRQSFIITSDLIRNGLIAWWPLNEESGSTVNDITDNGYDGTNNGATQAQPGPNGDVTSYSFNGDYIDIPSFSNFSSVSVSHWVRPSTISGNNASLGLLGNNYVTFWFGDRNNGITFEIEDPDGTDYNIGSSSFSSGSWYHVVGTWDGKKIRMYVDGNLIGESPADINMKNKGEGTSIGRRGNVSGYQDKFSGRICDIRVFNRALGSDEVQTIYDRGAGNYTY